MGGIGASSRWVCHRKYDFSLRHWPDGSVLFDDASGQIHCLTPVAGEVMALLMNNEARSAHALAHELLGELPTEADAEMMQNVLANFMSLNLIDQLSD